MRNQLILGAIETVVFCACIIGVVFVVLALAPIAG